MDTIDELEQGRRSYWISAWRDAFESLSRADQARPLRAEDLELLSTSAWMIGNDNDLVSAMERAHHQYLDDGQSLPAVRCAFWLGINLALRGEMGPATGWFGRAQRLVEREEQECVEHGYLLVPVLLASVAAGDHQAAFATASEAAEIGERFGEADLLALAVHEQGHALINQGRVGEGLALLDEAMVAATADELSPVVTGLVYCSVIEICQQVFALRRAQEWTAALTRWCDHQPDMVAFSGQCLVHRSEIMQLHGAWRDALDEARRACQRVGRGMNRVAAAQAYYRQGELHRLQGDPAAAADAYEETSRAGWEPQPGLALLWLDQGSEVAAAGAIRRVVGETTERLARARLLPAYVEIMLAVGDVSAAKGASSELEEIAEAYQSDVLAAMAAYAQAAVDLAEGDAQAALVALRRSGHQWQALEAPFEAARVRVLVGLACRQLGDEDTAALELDAARSVLAQLGARPALAQIDHLAGRASSDAHGLTARELGVLRLVASGKSNRAIATALFISEHTVARHVQNIFTKLGVSSRTAASAFAFKHHLA